MNYTDLILKLLSKRESVACSEDSLISDFSDKEDPKEAFNEWCTSHKIIIIRNPSEKNIILAREPKPSLKKTK